ncbi:MAG: DUF4236 domain-containing protein [Planctomycetes bacterium]|nr:DUF4236 domain-containing protein [Planctomycetota bacterium]
MGWRFRKVFRFGPLRWWPSRAGVGYSWGIPGLRIGVSANGSRFLSVGIPGTGLYFIKYFSSRAQPTSTGQLPGSAGGSQAQQPAQSPGPRSLGASSAPQNPPPTAQVPWWRQKNLP